MNKSINRKEFLFALIASLCFIVLALFSFFEDIWFAKTALLGGIRFTDVLEWLVFAALAVTLFMENRRAFLVAASVCALVRFLNMVLLFDTPALFSFLACAALVGVTLLAILENPLAEKTWFIPGALMLIGCLICWFSYKYFSNLALMWKTMLGTLIEAAAILFAGRWLKERGCKRGHKIL